MQLSKKTKIWIFSFVGMALLVSGGVYFSGLRTELFKGEVIDAEQTAKTPLACDIAESNRVLSGWSIKDDFILRAENDIYSFDSSNRIFHWNGSESEIITTQPTNPEGYERPQALQIVYAPDSDTDEDVYPEVIIYVIVTDSSREQIGKWSDGHWVFDEFDPLITKDDFQYNSANDVYAFGAPDGSSWGDRDVDRVYHWNGTTWEAVSPVGASHKLKVTGSGNSRIIYAISDDRTRVVKFVHNATVWSDLGAELPNNLGGIEDFHIVSENNYYVLAGDKNIWHWDGTSWTQYTSGAQMHQKMQYESGQLLYAIGMDQKIHKCIPNPDYTPPSDGEAPPPPVEADIESQLRAYFNFNEGRGDTTDTVAEIEGRLQGGTKWTPVATGQALRFDGVDDYVDLTNSPSVRGNGPFTVSAWVKTTTAKKMTILSQGDGSTRDGTYELTMNEDGKATCSVFNQGEGFAVTSTTPLNDGNWHHVACVALDVGNGRHTGRIYIDGKTIPEADQTATARTLNAGAVSVGRSNETTDGTKYFDGLIDDVRMYNRGLTGEEVNLLHTAEWVSRDMGGSVTLGQVLETEEIPLRINSQASPVEPVVVGDYAIATAGGTTNLFTGMTFTLHGVTSGHQSIRGNLLLVEGATGIKRAIDMSNADQNGKLIFETIEGTIMTLHTNDILELRIGVSSGLVAEGGFYLSIDDVNDIVLTSGTIDQETFRETEESGGTGLRTATLTIDGGAAEQTLRLEQSAAALSRARAAQDAGNQLASSSPEILETLHNTLRTAVTAAETAHTAAGVAFRANNIEARHVQATISAADRVEEIVEQMRDALIPVEHPAARTRAENNAICRERADNRVFNPADGDGPINDSPLLSGRMVDDIRCVTQDSADDACAVLDNAKPVYNSETDLCTAPIADGGDDDDPDGDQDRAGGSGLLVSFENLPSPIIDIPTQNQEITLGNLVLKGNVSGTVRGIVLTRSGTVPLSKIKSINIFEGNATLATIGNPDTEEIALSFSRPVAVSTQTKKLPIKVVLNDVRENQTLQFAIAVQDDVTTTFADITGPFPISMNRITFKRQLTLAEEAEQLCEHYRLSFDADETPQCFIPQSFTCGDIDATVGQIFNDLDMTQAELEALPSSRKQGIDADLTRYYETTYASLKTYTEAQKTARHCREQTTVNDSTLIVSSLVEADNADLTITGNGEFELGKFKFEANKEVSIFRIKFIKSRANTLLNEHIESFTLLDDFDEEVGTAQTFRGSNDADIAFILDMTVKPGKPVILKLMGKLTDAAVNGEILEMELEIDSLQTNAGEKQRQRSLKTARVAVSGRGAATTTGTGTTGAGTTTAGTTTGQDQDRDDPRLAALRTELESLSRELGRRDDEPAAGEQLLLDQIADLERRIEEAKHPTPENENDEETSRRVSVIDDDAPTLGDTATNGESQTQLTRPDRTSSSRTFDTVDPGISGQSTTQLTRDAIAQAGSAAPTLQSTARLHSAPERGNTGPGILIYAVVIGAGQLLYLKSKRKK